MSFDFKKFAIFLSLAAAFALLSSDYFKTTAPAAVSLKKDNKEKFTLKKSTLASSSKKDIHIALNNVASPLVKPNQKQKTIPTKPKDALDGEINLSFDSEANYRAFIKKILRTNPDLLLSRIDALRTLRLLKDDDLLTNDLLSEADGFGFNFLVNTPTPPAEETNRGRAQFENTFLDSLGVPENNGSWGEGVRVAVLDTAIGQHSSLENTQVQRSSVFDDSSELASTEQNHGTAVASLIASNSPEFSGIAPGADIIGIEVLDSSGSGTTFSVAQGIIEAVNQNAQIINLSLSTGGESAVLRAAIEYAEQAGVLLVAAAGNSEQGAVPYPAKYQNVLAVTSIDAQNLAAPFSNTAEEIDIAAPGVGIQSAGSENSYNLWSGTSFSAPLVTGAAAAFLSQNNDLSPAELRESILANTRDLGEPGEDNIFGTGALDIGRLINSNSSGIYDMAIADHNIRRKENTQNQVVVTVSVQNVGTETISTSDLRVRVDNRDFGKTVRTLKPGEVDFIEVSTTINPSTANQITIASAVSAQRDQNTSNDSKSNRVSVSLVPN